MSTLPPLSFKQTALVAGLLYLLIITFGITGEVFIRQALIAPGDASLTAQNILDNQGLLRLAFATDTVMAIADIALAILLYVLLRPVSPTLAAMAAAFRLTQMTIVAGGLLNQHEALLFLVNAGELGGLGGPALDALALQALNVHSHGYDLGLIFFGVNSLIVGYLLYRSADFPRLLGIMIAVSGAIYLTGSYLRFLAPDVLAAFQIAYLVPLLSETAFAFWLIFGVRRETARNLQSPRG